MGALRRLEARGWGRIREHPRYPGSWLLRRWALAMRIKQLRKRREMTQEALARAAGVSLAYVGRLETGHHDPMLSTLRELGKALGVPVTALLE